MNLFWFFHSSVQVTSILGSLHSMFNFLTFHRLVMINDYTMYLVRSSYLNLSCIYVCHHLFPYDQSFPSPSSFWARRSDRFVPQNQDIELTLGTAPSLALPVTPRYSSTLGHRTSSISTVQSLRRIESTVVVVSTCVSSAHSPVRAQRTTTSFVMRYSE